MTGGCENSQTVNCVSDRSSCVGRWAGVWPVAAVALPFSHCTDTAALALLQLQCGTGRHGHGSPAYNDTRHGVRYIRSTVQRVTGEYGWSTGGVQVGCG